MNMCITELLEPRRLLTGVVVNEEVNDFGASEFADDVIVQKDDRILVLGHTRGDPGGDQLFLARYDIDGTLDPFFGQNGRIFGEFAEFPRATGIALDKSGRIIIAGVTTGEDPAIAAMRFTKAGFIDRSFGNNGLATMQAGTGEVVNDVAVDSSGRVVTVGQARANPLNPSDNTLGWMVARFDAFGRADFTFGDLNEDFSINDGVSVFPVGIGESGATSVRLDGSRILVCGFGTGQEPDQPAEKRFALARLTKYGALDDDFGDGADGIVVVDFGLPSVAQDLDLVDDGRIVAVGNTLPTLDTPGEQILITRFDRGGSLDSSFAGGDGFTITGISGARSVLARGVVVDHRDRILIGAQINDAGQPAGDFNDNRFVLARYLSDGTPDTSFAPGGALIEEVKPGEDSLEQLANLSLQRDGKDARVILAGNTGTTIADQDIAVIRIATDATQKTGSTRIKGHTLLVRGTDHDDTVSVSADFSSDSIVVNVNGAITTITAAGITRIGINTKDGDDEATCSVGGDIITTIQGGDDDDDLRLLGDAKGRLEGQDGDDDLVGSARSDRLRGGDGDDRLFGGDGSDDLTGDDGVDQLYGEGGDDELKADDGYHDDIDGGDGDDEARVDIFDFYTRVDHVDFV